MVYTSSQLGEHTDPDGRWKFRYTVTVRWAQNVRTKDGVKAMLKPPGAVYNVYHADGGAAGGAARGAPGVAPGVASEASHASASGA